MAASATQNRASLIAFLLVMALLVTLAVVMIAPYLVAIFMGAILALLCQPVYRRLAKRFRPRVAALVVTLGAILLVVGPFVGFTALAAKQAITLGEKLAEAEFSTEELATKLFEVPPFSAMVESPAEIEAAFRSAVTTVTKNASSYVLGIAKGIPDVLLQLVLGSIACFFFLVDGHAAMLWIGGKFPLDLEVRGRLQGSFKDTAISVVWASMAAAFSQALVMVFAFAVLRVPAAFFGGGATFILAWIPLVGTAPVWIAGAIYLFLQGATAKVAAMAGFGFLTSIVDNFVRPWVLKGRGEMHPLVSLVAIFGGIHMFGIVGVFFGPILAAVVITVLQVWPVVGGRSGLSFPGAVVTTEPESIP